MTRKKVLRTVLIVIASISFVLLAGVVFLVWKMSSYTTGNWTVDSAVRSNIEAVYPDLDYEIISRKIYDASLEDKEKVVWELTVKCNDDGETYTVYDINNKTGDLYLSIADYAEIHFDYVEKIMDDIDEHYDLGDHRVRYENEIYSWSRYEFSISDEALTDETVEQIANVYDGALAASKGNYPVEITCVVRNGDAEISFFTRDFYKDGKITMDKEARIAYIRDKVSNRG